MSKKLRWLTESQIGDLIWESFFEGDYVKLKFREFEIGNGRADFVTFNDRSIDIFELKITASSHTIFQVLNYKSDLESQVINTFYFNDKNRDHTKAPTVKANIIARFFDSEIIKDCNALNIRMWKAHIDDKTGELTSVELFENECPDERLNSKKLDHLLYESFK